MTLLNKRIRAIHDAARELVMKIPLSPKGVIGTGMSWANYVQDMIKEEMVKVILSPEFNSEPDEVKPSLPRVVQEVIEYLRGNKSDDTAIELAGALENHYSRKHEDSNLADQLIPTDQGKTLAMTIADRFARYSQQLGWGLTPYQPECWAMLDDAIRRLVINNATSAGDLIKVEPYDIKMELRARGMGIDQANWLVRDIEHAGFVILKHAIEVANSPGPNAYLASSLAKMIEEWVQAGIDFKSDWKSGLKSIIKSRIDRLSGVLDEVPDHHMKKALFQCIKLGVKSRAYGGVLVGDNKYAWMRYSIEEGNSAEDQSREA